MRILPVMACIILISCKKEKASEYNFQSCNLTSKNIRVLASQSGLLSYTNKLGSSQFSTFSYFIKLSGQLPLEVCNMPSSLSLKENETKSVLFSGKMVVLPDEVDAISTTIELTDLTLQ